MLHLHYHLLNSSRLITSYDIGSCFDELELNKSVCDKHGVNIAGVIINKVIPEKASMIRSYMSRTLAKYWDDVPLLGCIPDKPSLGRTTKLNLADTSTVISAVAHYEKYIDFDRLLERTRTTKTIKSNKQKLA